MKNKMKKLIVLIALIFGVFVLNAQTYKYQVITNDTLTDADTISEVIPYTFYGDEGTYYYSVQIVCDSLDDNPNGTAYLRQCNDEDDAVYTAISGKTLTLNGSGTYETFWTNASDEIGFMGRKLQIYILGAGTATVKCNAWVTIKRKPKVSIW